MHREIIVVRDHCINSKIPFIKNQFKNNAVSVINSLEEVVNLRNRTSQRVILFRDDGRYPEGLPEIDGKYVVLTDEDVLWPEVIRLGENVSENKLYEGIKLALTQHQKEMISNHRTTNKFKIGIHGMGDLAMDIIIQSIQKIPNLEFYISGRENKVSSMELLKARIDSLTYGVPECENRLHSVTLEHMIENASIVLLLASDNELKTRKSRKINTNKRESHYEVNNRIYSNIFHELKKIDNACLPLYWVLSGYNFMLAMDLYENNKELIDDLNIYVPGYWDAKRLKKGLEEHLLEKNTQIIAGDKITINLGGTHATPILRLSSQVIRNNEPISIKEAYNLDTSDILKISQKVKKISEAYFHSRRSLDVPSVLSTMLQRLLTGEILNLGGPVFLSESANIMDFKLPNYGNEGILHNLLVKQHINYDVDDAITYFAYNDYDTTNLGCLKPLIHSLTDEEKSIEIPLLISEYETRQEILKRLK